MIHELKDADRRIISLDCIFPEALAVVEGNNPGWIFVDDPHTPRAALIWAHGIQGFYAIGNADCAVFKKELGVFTDEVLHPRLLKLGLNWLEISGNEAWNTVIENAFAERNLQCSHQWVYTLESRRYKIVTHTTSKDEYQVLRVDPYATADLFVNNKEFLISKLVQFWGDVDPFYDTGVGHVLITGEEIASLCISGFVAGNVHAIDIETGERYRRKGFAEAVARAYIEECAKKQLNLHWDCMAKNTASTRLAEKLGFVKSHEYTLYSFPIGL